MHTVKERSRRSFGSLASPVASHTASGEASPDVAPPTPPPTPYRSGLTPAGVLRSKLVDISERLTDVRVERGSLEQGTLSLAGLRSRSSSVVDEAGSGASSSGPGSPDRRDRTSQPDLGLDRMMAK